MPNSFAPPPKTVRNTYRDFLGRPNADEKDRKSILGFAFKNLFFTSNDNNEETYKLLKTLNRVLEYENHINVYNEYFCTKLEEGGFKEKDAITTQDLENFQAYILHVVEMLTKEYEDYLAKAKTEEDEKHPRAARTAAYQAEELRKILQDFKKYHNRWARKYKLKERIKNDIKNLGNSQQKTYGFEELKSESEAEIERTEKRKSKKMFKPFGISITGLVAAGCAFLVFNGLISTLGFALLPAALIALAVFVVNVRVFHGDTANLFKFKSGFEVLKAFVLGADYANGKTKGEHPAMTTLIVVSSLGMGLGFGLATAVGVFASLASFAFFPVAPAIALAALIGFVTFVSFNGVLNSGLRSNFNKLKNFSLKKEWKELENEWKEIKEYKDPKLSNEENEHNKLRDQIHFVVDKIVKAIAWPLLIAISVVGVIATLGVLHQDITTLFAAIPSVSSTIASLAAAAVVSLVALPETVFNFTTVRNMFNIVFGLVAEVIAAPIVAIASPVKTGAALERDLKTSSQEAMTFIQRFKRDPWKTVGRVWEALKTGGLFLACGVNAFGNGAFVAGGSATLQLSGMPVGIANPTAQSTGTIASAGCGISFSKAAVDEDRAAKVEIGETQSKAKVDEAAEKAASESEADINAEDEDIAPLIAAKSSSTGSNQPKLGFFDKNHHAEQIKASEHFAQSEFFKSAKTKQEERKGTYKDNKVGHNPPAK